ncbi:hypothetical protein NX059_006752 [Plenodomus lindquistii]|nr:hypothetical protein NX059_006752 [Plenodomus lindquistii]
MSAHNPPAVEKSEYINENVHEDKEVERTYTAIETSSDRTSLDIASTKKKFYKPGALRTFHLLAFCVVALAIGTLLQITAAAYRDRPSIQGLINGPVNVRARQVITSDVPTPTQELRGVIGTDSFILPDPSFTRGNDNPAKTTDSAITKMLIPTQGTDDPTQTLYSFVFQTSTELATAPNPNSYTSSKGLGQGQYFIGAYLPTLPEVFFSSIWSRHLLAFLGALNMGLIILCTLLSSETMYLESEGTLCGIQAGSEGESNPDCIMTLRMRQEYAWAVGAILFAVALFTVWVIVFTCPRVTGLHNDPTSIAGHASLMDDDLIKELCDSHQDHTKRYALVQSHENGPVTIVSTRTNRSGSKHGHFSMHPALLITFWLAQIGILVMLFYYRFVSKPNTGNKFEDFMNSQDIGVSTFMTALGLGVKFYWGWIEGYMRTMRPYLALASPHGATAAQSVLLRSPSHSVTTLLQAETWKYPLLAIVTFMSLLSEVLVIMLNGVPFTPSLLRKAFDISVFASIVILFAMIVSLSVVIVWGLSKKTRRCLPEAPECIAHVIELLGDAEGRRAMAQLVNGKHGAEVGHDQQMRVALQDVVSSEPGISGWRIVKLPARPVV